MALTLSGRVVGAPPEGPNGLRVRVEDGLIAAVEPATVPDSAPHLLPGLVDLQVNGYAGADINAPDVDAQTVIELVRRLAGIGTATLVPTIVTAPTEQITRSLIAVRDARESDAQARAAVPFVHLEGPSLSPVDGARGAHDARYVRPPQLAELQHWQQVSGDLVGMVTLSPHHPGSLQFIEDAVRRGVRVAIGHTHADVEQLQAAVRAGARYSTHLGNGIQASLPRHPNIIWAQLADDRLTAGLIADGHHLPDDTLRVMLRAKGAGRAFVVSDSVALAGEAPGRYRTPVGGEVDLHPDGRLCVAGTDYLAGAANPLLTALTTLHRIGCELAEAVALTAGTPGRIAGRGGAITIGARADLLSVRWQPRPELVAAYLGGQQVG